MSVQNGNSKISVHPDLASNLLCILVLTTSKAYCVKKGILHFICVVKGLFRKYLVITTKKSKLNFFLEIFACPKRRFLGNCLSTKQAGRALPVAQKCA